MCDVPKHWEVVRESNRALDKQGRLINTKRGESNLLERRAGRITEWYHGREVLSEDTSAGLALILEERLMEGCSMALQGLWLTDM